jgi:putative acetyltransferase
MAKKQLVVRALQHADLPEVLDIISSCRREYGLEGRVQHLLEPSDLAMTTLYGQPRCAYFVAVVGDAIAGGGGIAPLSGNDTRVCELQRMYLLPGYREQGIGHALLEACVGAARGFGYSRCYAETITEMSTALSFYARHGFRTIGAPMGETGHEHNDRWLLLEIGPAFQDGWEI